MKILAISSEIPSSTDMPGCPRLYNLFKQLSKDNSASLLLLNIGAEQCKNLHSLTYLNEVFDNIEAIKKPESVALFNKYMHRFTLRSNLDHSARYPAHMAKTKRKLESISKDYDIIYVKGLGAAQYIPDNLQSKVVVDFVDSMTLLMQSMLSDIKYIKEKILYSLELFSTKLFEKHLLNRFTQGIAISPRDKSYLNRLSDSCFINVIPNGTDIEFFSSNRTSPKAQIIFTGVMDYAPNIDAVCYFANKVFPGILKSLPKVEFFIVGKSPAPEIKQLSERTGITVTGEVDDIRPYINDSSVYVAPLRIGAGMKNKILSAMSMKIPVVATTESVQGIEIEAGKDILIADTPTEIANTVIKILDKEKDCSDIVENAYETVRSNYSWSKSADMLLKVLKAQAESKKLPE